MRPLTMDSASLVVHVGRRESAPVTDHNGAVRPPSVRSGLCGATGLCGAIPADAGHAVTNQSCTAADPPCCRHFAPDDDLAIFGFDRAGRPLGLRRSSPRPLAASLLVLDLAFSLGAYQHSLLLPLFQHPGGIDVVSSFGAPRAPSATSRCVQEGSLAGDSLAVADIRVLGAVRGRGSDANHGGSGAHLFDLATSRSRCGRWRISQPDYFELAGRAGSRPPR